MSVNSSMSRRVTSRVRSARWPTFGAPWGQTDEASDMWDRHDIDVNFKLRTSNFKLNERQGPVLPCRPTLLRSLLMRRRRFVAIAFLLTLIAGVKAQQMLMAPTPKSGGTVNPAFEGWYSNPDGTKSISFGYYNRNTEEALDIPIGPDNIIAPGEANQGQPTHFEPRRHWGVFAVKVPADFSKE